MWLKFFSKDKEKLTLAFMHMFQKNKFYAAMENDKIIGITACTDGKSSPVKLNKKELCRHLGIVMGTIAGIVLKREFENHPYPFEIIADTSSIEFVAVSPDYRRHGVAFEMINYIHKSEPYNNFVLEVADTNTTAMNLYKKIGYKEFMRIPGPNLKKSGFNFLVYMKYEKREVK